jgi:hypothetical protein
MTHLLDFAIQDDFPPTRLKANELIEIVNFHADFFAGQEAHDNQLAILSGV